LVELITLTPSFWNANGEAYRAANSPSEGDAGMPEALWKMPHARVAWLLAVFLLAYVGVEVALGGWIVTFMIQARNGDHFASGMTATGFWLGITVGRVVLGFVTPRLGVKLAVLVGSFRVQFFLAGLTNRKTSTRYMFRQLWAWNFCSGLYLSFMSQLSLLPSRASS
jgi:fucose permease